MIHSKPNPPGTKYILSTTASVKSTPLQSDSAGYLEAYSAQPVKGYAINLKTGETALHEGATMKAQLTSARVGPLKGVSERIEEFITEEDNLGEDTMNPKKF